MHSRGLGSTLESTHWRKESLFNKCCWENQTHIWKSVTRLLLLISYKNLKVDFKARLNCKFWNYEATRSKHKRSHCSSEMRKDGHGGRLPKHEEKRQIHRNEKFCTENRQVQLCPIGWEKMFANYTSDT